MDTSKTRVLLQEAAKIFKAGLKSKTWDIYGMSHFITTTHCEGCDMCKAYALHVIEASKVLTVEIPPREVEKAFQIAWPNIVHHIDVKLLRSPSNCQDPVQPKINPLPLLQLRSNHPLRLWHYTNQTPELWAPPEPSNALLSLSENSEPSENPNHIPVSICLHHCVLVLLNSKLVFMSPSQFSPFHFRYIKPFQYSCSLILASALPLYISTSLLLNSSNSL